MSTEHEQLLTIIMAPIAFVTGYLGLTLTEVDLMMAIGLKALSSVSMILIIAVNWDKGVARIKKALRK